MPVLVTPLRQRRRIISYPLVVRLMLAMTLMPAASYCEALARIAGLLAEHPVHPRMPRPDGEGDHAVAAAGPGRPDGRHPLPGGRTAGRR